MSRELHRPADERDPQDLDLGDVLDLRAAGRWRSVGALASVAAGARGRELVSRLWRGLDAAREKVRVRVRVAPETRSRRLGLGVGSRRRLCT